MLYDFMFLINVNPQVALWVVWFPCQSPDWENYAGDEEMMMPIKVSNSSFKFPQNMCLFLHSFEGSLLLKALLITREISLIRYLPLINMTSKNWSYSYLYYYSIISHGMFYFLCSSYSIKDIIWSYRHLLLHDLIWIWESV